MRSRPLAALRRNPKRGAVIGALLAVAIVAAVVAVRTTNPTSRRPPGVARGEATDPAASDGERRGGGVGGGGTEPRSGGSGAPGDTTGPSNPTAGTATGGGTGGGAVGNPRPTDEAGERPPEGSTSGGRVDPPTQVPPRPPVRCAATGEPRAASLPPRDENEGRRWVTVGRLAGNCDLSSPRFRLQGIDTRLVWRSDADSFAVFLVDAVQGREATGGFADGQCAGSCSESQPIVPPAGDFSLEVQAGDAPWEVEVQEYRRP